MHVGIISHFLQDFCRYYFVNVLVRPAQLTRNGSLLVRSFSVIKRKIFGMFVEILVGRNVCERGMYPGVPVVRARAVETQFRIPVIAVKLLSVFIRNYIRFVSVNVSPFYRRRKSLVRLFEIDRGKRRDIVVFRRNKHTAQSVFQKGIYTCGESFCRYGAYTYPFVRYLKSVSAVFSPAIAVEGEN